MAILLYCISSESASTDVGSGVAGRPVLRFTQAGVDTLFSQNTSAESWTGASLKQSAKEFHKVLQRVFATHAIIPFRFPTLMRDEQELSSHLRDNAAEYSSQLEKFENSVQMDISIARTEPMAPASAQASGAEYLRNRQKQSDDLEVVAKQIQELTGEKAQEWNNRSASNGLKLFALLNRASVAAFHERLKKFSVPSNLTVRVSGPWPVSEFLELTQR